MKTIVLFASLFIFHIKASSQSNFVPGIVVTDKGDSLIGKIDYRDWIRTPQTISFANNKGEINTYSTTTIKSFTIIPQSETYISKTVEIDMTPDDADKVLSTNTTAPLTIEQTIFLLQLVKHPLVSLYQFVDINNKAHFYFTNREGKMEELIHHYLYSEHSSKLEHNTRYKQQLGELIAACQTLRKKTENLRYLENEIKELIIDFLNCIAPSSPIEVKKKDPLSVKFGVLAGVMFNSYKFKGSIDIARDNYGNNTSPVFGISVDMSLSRSYDKLHIVNELVYKRYKTSNSFTSLNPSGFSYQSDIAFDFSYIQLNTIIRYFFGTSSRVRPFLNAGMGNGSIISEKENILHTKYSSGLEQTEKGIDGPKHYEFSFLFGGGFGIKKTKLELRYAHSKKAFSPFYNLDVQTNSPQAIFTYQF